MAKSASTEPTAIGPADTGTDPSSLGWPHHPAIDQSTLPTFAAGNIRFSTGSLLLGTTDVIITLSPLPTQLPGQAIAVSDGDLRSGTDDRGSYGFDMVGGWEGTRSSNRSKNVSNRSSNRLYAEDAAAETGTMHIENTALLVDDYDEAIDFFVDALGFELVEDSPSTTNH